jgi:hypothetical protein
MLKRILRALLAAVCLIASHSLAGAETTHAKPADRVFRHGAVYTLNAARSWAEAVAISQGRIVYVGMDGEVEPWIGPKTNGT